MYTPSTFYMKSAVFHRNSKTVRFCRPNNSLILSMNSRYIQLHRIFWGHIINIKIIDFLGGVRYKSRFFFKKLNKLFGMSRKKFFVTIIFLYWTFLGQPYIVWVQVRMSPKRACGGGVPYVPYKVEFLLHPVPNPEILSINM